MTVIKSLSNDAGVNIALEQKLMKMAGEDFLLFYKNSSSVIVGRNQSIEAEADEDFCTKFGIKIVRRTSGGGAVYHDLGNLNYSFITDRKDVSLLENNPLPSMIEALASIGIEACAGKRREILVDGLKISGTASYSTGQRQMFHGTLLHSTDLDMMNSALRSDPAKRGRKCASVPSEVLNIGQRLPMDIEEFTEKLILFFMKYYGCTVSESV